MGWIVGQLQKNEYCTIVDKKNTRCCSRRYLVEEFRKLLKRSEYIHRLVCAVNLDRLVNNYIKMPVANQVHFYLLLGLYITNC